MRPETKSAAWNLAKKVLPALIGLVIIAAFVVKMGPGELLRTISGVSLTYLLLSAAVLAGAMVLKGFRWHLLLRPAGVRDLRLALYSYFAGQVTNELLPTGSGEVVRIAVVKGRKDVRFMTLVPAIALERVSDVALLLILSVSLAAIFISPIVIALLLVVIFMCVIAFARPSIVEYFANGVKSIGARAGPLSKIVGFGADKVIEMCKSIEFYGRDVYVIILCLLLTVISWVALEAGSQYLLLLGFGVHISFTAMLGIVAISWVLGTVSMLPGGLGAREVVYALALSSVSAGTEFAVAFSIAMLYRAMVYVLFAGLASVMYLVNKKTNVEKMASKIE